MIYLSYITFIILCGLTNRVRGDGDINRVLFVVMNGLMSYQCFGDWKLSLIIGVGLWIWLIRGWYKYTMSHMGDLKWLVDMQEVKSIDWVTTLLVGKPEGYNKARLWGTVGMAIRGFSMSIPLFSALAIYYGVWQLHLMSLVMLLQGIIYRQVDDNYFRLIRVKRWYNYEKAEIFTGYLYGTLIVLSMYIGS